MTKTNEMIMVDMVDAMMSNTEIKAILDTLVDSVEEAGLSRKQDYVYLARLRGVEFADIAGALGVSENKAMQIWGKAVEKVGANFISRELARLNTLFSEEAA